MTQLELDLPEPTSDVVHALLPNMGVACQVDYLAALKRGERSSFGTPWSEVTCTWCHALGHGWYLWACRIMQGLDPVTRERRNTEPDRRLLAGIDEAA